MDRRYFHLWLKIPRHCSTGRRSFVPLFAGQHRAPFRELKGKKLPSVHSYKRSERGRNTQNKNLTDIIVPTCSWAQESHSLIHQICFD